VKPQLNGSPITSLQMELLQSRRFLMADLYTFYLANSDTDTFTNLDIPITVSSVTYKANSIRVDGLKYKIEVGTSVDEQTIKISATSTDDLAGANFLTSILNGAMDSGYVARDRAFWPIVTGIPAIDFTYAPTLVIRLCYMRMSTITKGGRTSVEMKLKSPLVLLDLNMPRNYFQPGCLHTLFDGGCTLVKSSFGHNGVVSAVTPLSVGWSGGISPPAGADGISNFAFGRLLFTTGILANSQYAIQDNDAVNLIMQIPFSTLPSIGDSFTAYVGCSKTLNTCTAKFSNNVHWRGYDKVPPVYISL
jgi:hypothetical protein